MTSTTAVRGRALRRIARNPLGVLGGALLVIVVVAGVFAPLLAPYPPAEVHFSTPFQVPGTVGFALGTDDLGRDVLSRVLYGTRASLEVGLLSVLLAVLVGVPLGLAAINGGGLGNAAIALGIANIPTMIRVVRAETLRLRERDFVLAARAMDAGSWWILARHVLPNALPAIIVQATVIMPAAVLGEAVLSFLGLGIQPPAPSLGIMLSDAQQFLFRTLWPGVFPGLAIAVICLGFNLFGDALRDALDPQTVSEGS